MKRKETMSDKDLRDMWNNTTGAAGTSGYEQSTIERWLGRRSVSVVDKVNRMLQLDIWIKTAFAVLLAVDAALYWRVQSTVSYTCLGAIAVALSLAWFELRVLREFTTVSDWGQNTKEALSRTVIFLRSRFLTALLSTSLTYLFVFLSGALLYFFITYGQLRPLDNMDVFVFSTLCLIGVVSNFAVNRGQIEYHARHIEACLSDLNDNVLEVVTSSIESQQKQDRAIKMLLALVVVLGFVVLIAVLKALGV
jgi:hypothetical protein